MDKAPVEPKAPKPNARKSAVRKITIDKKTGQPLDRGESKTARTYTQDNGTVCTDY